MACAGPIGAFAKKARLGPWLLECGRPQPARAVTIPLLARIPMRLSPTIGASETNNVSNSMTALSKPSTRQSNGETWRYPMTIRFIK